MKNTVFVALILAIQAVCAFFFIAEIVVTVFGLDSRPVPWDTKELLEIGAAIGLLLGFVLGAIALQRTIRRSNHAEKQLRAVSIAFQALLDERFTAWGLTPAERDVALFAIKGMSTAEIAQLRKTSEGTVKAQTAAIYRKAGVTGRPQLLSLFIEDMLAGDAPRLADGAADQSAA